MSSPKPTDRAEEAFAVVLMQEYAVFSSDQGQHMWVFKDFSSQDA